MTAIDLTAVLRDAPAGKWIALSPRWDRILATASSLVDAMEMAKAQGEPNPVMMKAPPAGMMVL